MSLARRGHAPATPEPACRRASQLVNRATRHVERHKPGCKRTPEPGETFTHATSSAALLSVLGVLRRPATAHENAIARHVEANHAAIRRVRHGHPQRVRIAPVPPDLPYEGIYLDYIRVAHAGGHAFTIVPAQDIDSYVPPPARCDTAIVRRVRRRSRHAPVAVRRRARAMAAQQRREDRKTPAPHEGVALFAHDGAGTSGPGVAKLKARGECIAEGDHHPTRTHVSCLVPDGVASVSARDRPARSHQPHHGARRYSAARRTALVHENMASFTIARYAPDAAPNRLLWRNSVGHVVHVVRRPNVAFSVSTERGTGIYGGSRASPR